MICTVEIECTVRVRRLQENIACRFRCGKYMANAPLSLFPGWTAEAGRHGPAFDRRTLSLFIDFVTSSGPRKQAYLLRNSWDLFAPHVVNSFPEVVASWLRHATKSIVLCSPIC